MICAPSPGRRRSRAVLKAAGLAAALAVLSGPAAGQDDEAPDGGPAPAAPLEELNRLLDELEGLLGTIPRFEMPEITEDGDIILRRRDDPPPEDGEGGESEEPPGPRPPPPPPPPQPPRPPDAGPGGGEEVLEL